MGTAPDANQLIEMLPKITGAEKTIEVGVFTAYSLLLTALTIPEDGKIVAIDLNRESYEIGRPVIKKAGVDHKIDFIESEALPVLDKLLANHANEGGFDFAYVDADKINYLKYHERMMKLLKIGGIVVYDNMLRYGTVAMLDEELVLERLKNDRIVMRQLNEVLTTDPRINLSHVPLGDGTAICRRVC